MSTQNRREFMKGTGALALAATSVACVTGPASRVIGANDRIGMGLIGCGGRGRGVSMQFAASGRIEFLGVCDVFDKRREQAKTAFAKNAKEYGDHRKLLDDPKIDAVYIATPDHSHAAIALDALTPGKHVHCDKPLTYALGRGLTPADQGAVRTIAAQLAAHDYKFSSLVLAIVNTPQFRQCASAAPKP